MAGETKISQGESNIFPRIWKVGAVNTTSFTVGTPAYTQVQVTDMLLSGVTVPTAMTAEVSGQVTIERGATLGTQQDIYLRYRVNGGGWTQLSFYLCNIIAPATEPYSSPLTIETLDLTPGNTYDFQIVFACGTTGTTVTVRHRKLIVRTFLAG
jgi:hypothetical protein